MLSIYSMIVISRRTRNSVLVYSKLKLLITASVSTWSPLATAFNTRPGRKLNLSLIKDDAGLFGVPELRSHDGFYAMRERTVWETEKLISEACGPDRTRKMVEIFDELSDTLCKVADLAEFVRIAHPQAAHSQAAEDACVSISGIVESFSVDGDQVLVTGLYADSPNAMVREAAYRIYLHPDKHQEYLLSEMLSSRHELAQLCGFPTFSHRALKASTAETPDTVNQFLDIMTQRLHKRAAVDFDVMKKLKAATNTGSTEEDLAPWDTPYYTHKVKRDWLQVGSTEFSPYFSLGTCMEGLNILTNSLYNISLISDELAPGEVWAPDVYKLAVFHEREGLLGHIYCDFYERPGKPNQDCHFTIRGGKELPDGSYQNPVVVLMLNLPTPCWSNPSLLTPSMVDNLFHEMGHAMHSMLARTRYQHVTGTRCSTDFAEVPSVLMEYFAADPRVVRTFAKHFQTQECMPEEMLVRLCASKHLFAASEMQVQVFYSALDQRYHGSHPLEGSTTSVLAELQKQYYGIPYVPNTAWQLRFSHLVGYGAKYYAYLLSRAVAAWIWQTYFEADPLNSFSGERYRQECLAHGGGKPARELVADFLGREVTPENLANSLINEIDSKNEHINRIRQ
ncbi:mitochondrial intermediate peptidase isoform X2 [Cryptotermes secundus]|uniref:mitochondrial intermediate peptidase isoform X2 n=1 Tax=Cryptotermes secundus TaxID=105785 RepID=UPI000CD7BA5B|nr:mitochondrial intermediate peptidase isoform X2 [Cryptotermes secundus]